MTSVRQQPTLKIVTVLPTKSDSDSMICLQSYRYIPCVLILSISEVYMLVVKAIVKKNITSLSLLVVTTVSAERWQASLKSLCGIN